MQLKNRLNKKINKNFKKIVDKTKSSVVLFNQDKEIKNKGEIKMLALNLSELKVSKNTKSHIWNRHRLHKKQVIEALNQGILDVFEVEDEKIAVFTKGFFMLIIDKDNNLITAYQSRPSKYKKYLENFSK